MVPSCPYSSLGRAQERLKALRTGADTTFDGAESQPEVGRINLLKDDQEVEIGPRRRFSPGARAQLARFSISRWGTDQNNGMLGWLDEPSSLPLSPAYCSYGFRCQFSLLAYLMNH